VSKRHLSFSLDYSTISQPFYCAAASQAHAHGAELANQLAATRQSLAAATRQREESEVAARLAAHEAADHVAALQRDLIKCVVL
jgi:hypothetical protein